MPTRRRGGLRSERRTAAAAREAAEQKRSLEQVRSRPSFKRRALSRLKL